MTKQEKLLQINKLIEQIKEINKDRDFAVFFSAVALDEDKAGMHHAFYTDGAFEEINLAIGTGVSIIADQAALQGADRMEVLESVVDGIGFAEELRHKEKALDSADSESGDSGVGNA